MRHGSSITLLHKYYIVKDFNTRANVGLARRLRHCARVRYLIFSHHGSDSVLTMFESSNFAAFLSTDSHARETSFVSIARVSESFGDSGPGSGQRSDFWGPIIINGIPCIVLSDQLSVKPGCGPAPWVPGPWMRASHDGCFMDLLDYLGLTSSTY